MSVRSRLSPVVSWRFLQLQAGLALFGLAGAAMLEAHVGVDPWSVLHEALAIRTNVSFGTITQVVGLVFVLVSALWLRVRPGLGTVCNMLLIGPWLDWFRALGSLPRQSELAPGVVQLLVGIALVGVASGAYITAGFGTGPRDSFVIGISRRFGIGIARTRIAIEVTVVAVGWLLGGPVGLGTVLFAVLMGPSMQLSLGLFGHASGSATVKQV